MALAFAFSAGTATASAATDEPLVTDAAGDANVVEDPLIQVSHAPADLISGRIETLWEEVLHGDDGIDHRATGVRLRIGTLEGPTATGPTMLLGFDTRLQGCWMRIRAFLRGATPQPDDPAHGSVQIQMIPMPQQECPDAWGYYSNPAWTAAVDAARNEVVLTLPFASMSAERLRFFREGAAFTTPALEARVGMGAWHRVDSGPASEKSFVIGSDMPPDVPCTSGCPSSTQ